VYVVASLIRVYFGMFQAVESTIERERKPHVTVRGMALQVETVECSVRQQTDIRQHII
jgi:hypothetical protein